MCKPFVNTSHIYKQKQLKEKHEQYIYNEYDTQYMTQTILNISATTFEQQPLHFTI